MRPVHRFAAPAEGAGTAALPRATLEDDTRPVLRVPRSQIVAWSASAPVTPKGEVEVSQLLRGRLAAASKLVVRAEIAAGRERGPKGRLFAARFPVPAAWGAREVSVAVRGVPIGTDALEWIETEAVAIPAGARLEFAIGVLEPELGSDPLAFEVDACAESCDTVYRAELDPARAGDRGWRDARVPLDALAGSRRRFVFRAERLARTAPFSLPLWANPTLYAPAPDAADAPSLILLSID